MTILESKPIASSNLVDFERTGMFSAPMSLNVIQAFTASDHEVIVKIAPSYVDENWQFDRCDMTHPLVRVGMLSPDENAMCVSREEIASPNFPGFVLYSESLEDLIMIMTPARPEGCPFECWFPWGRKYIGFTDDNIMPVLVWDGNTKYTTNEGSKFHITTAGAFPLSQVAPKPLITYTYDEGKRRYYAVKGKRLWVFHPIDRTLNRVKTPINLVHLASLFGYYH